MAEKTYESVEKRLTKWVSMMLTAFKKSENVVLTFLVAVVGIPAGMLAIWANYSVFELSTLYKLAFLGSLLLLFGIVLSLLEHPEYLPVLVLVLWPVSNRLKDVLFIEIGSARISIETGLIIVLFLFLLPRMLQGEFIRFAIGPLFLIFVGIFTGVFSTYGWGESLGRVFEGMAIPMLWFLVAGCLIETNGSRSVLVGLATLVSIGTFYALVQFVTTFERTGSVYYNSNIFAETMVLTLPLFFVLAISKNRSMRYTSLIALAADIIGLLLTMSRGAWVAVAFAIGVVSLAIPKLRLRTLVLFAGLLIATFTSSFLRTMLLARRLYVVTSEVGNSASERLLGWQSSLQMIKSNLLGYGLGSFAKVYPDFKSPLAVANLDSAHNFFLNVGVELGVMGLIVLLGIYVVLLLRTGKGWLNKTVSWDRRLLSLGLFGAFTAHSIFAVLTGTEFVHRHIVIGQLLFWTLAAVSISHQRRGEWNGSI